MATAAAPLSAVADAPAVPEARAQRWLGLDMFRFTAVLLMVEGHVFSTLLAPDWRADGAGHALLWWRHHLFVHGYTAPMFLFGSGLAFGYTTFRKWDLYTQGGAAAVKRFKRYFWLMVIGYALHLPEAQLTRLIAIDDPARLRDMLQVDVLQHIAVSLALCQLLVLVVRKQRVVVWIVGALGMLAVFAAPWAWSWDLSGLPLALTGYLNASTGSQFPLFPWAGFTYLGVVVAYAIGAGKAEQMSRDRSPSGRSSVVVGAPDRAALLTPLAQVSSSPPSPATAAHDRRSVSSRLAWPLLLLALLAMIAPVIINRIGTLPLPRHDFWRTDPLYTFWRLGNVMLVLALLCFAERGVVRLGWLGARAGRASWPRRAFQWALPWVRAAGAQSLVIYVVHMIVLYGCVLTRGMRDYPETSSLSLAWTLVVTLALSVVMLVLARLWTRLQDHPRAYASMQWAMILGLVVLLLKP